MVQKPREKSRGRPSQRMFTVQVRFEGGEDIPILFANHIFIRNSPDGFILSFAQSHGPYIVHTTREVIEREGVVAKIIARLMIPPNRIREFVELLQDQLKKAERTQE